MSTPGIVLEQPGAAFSSQIILVHLQAIPLHTGTDVTMRGQK